MKNKIAVFASGCFWGTEYYFSKVKGVVSSRVGYSGGKTKNPTYKQVCAGDTGHVEAVEVTYDTKKTNYKQLAQYFFETHNPTQDNGQGPDIGSQYRSVIFYSTEKEKKIAQELIEILRKKGLDITTEIKKLNKFWLAEDYHQNYYYINGGSPYCHIYHKLF